MARPKPPEDAEAILIRMPETEAKRLRELAALSRNSKGQALSANQYCVAVLSRAVATNVTVVERTLYDLIPAEAELKVAEDAEGKQKKRA